MRNALLTPIAIVLAAALIAGAMVWSVQSVLVTLREASEAQLALYQAQLAAYQAQLAQVPAPGAPPAAGPPPAVDVAQVTTAGEPFIGAPDAPATMAYWFDYQCPFCQRVEQTVMPDLIKNYVTPGMLRIVFKDFAFLGPDSQTAALAGRAVWDVAPEKFGEWHSAMFSHQDEENGGWGSKADVLALTRTIPGIDAAKVEALMTDKAAEYEMALQNSGLEGSNMGVSGTPGAVIGKRLIVGAQPYAQFKQAVDAALADTKATAAGPAR
jgi:protein-disulfide isomerase